MLIFSGSSNATLAKKIAKSLGKKLSEIEIVTFPDKENRVRVIDRVLGEDVVVVQSTGVSPNRYYMELFFILDSVKRSGAKSITLVIPYLGYQRQDHIFRDGESVSLEVIIKILESLGVNKIVSLDLHSIKIPELFKVSVKHLSALPVFSQKIEEMFEQEFDQVTLISPDKGGIRRIKLLSQLLGSVEFASIEKERDLNTGEVKSLRIDGKVKKIAILVDDVISTGQTLISAANLLKKNGAKRIFVFATHGIFAGDAPLNLQKSEIEKVIATDTIEIRSNHKFEKLQVVSVAPQIARALRE